MKPSSRLIGWIACVENCVVSYFHSRCRIAIKLVAHNQHQLTVGVSQGILRTAVSQSTELSAGEYITTFSDCCDYVYKAILFRLRQCPSLLL